MKKLHDFGEKIGGAKKDIWAMFHSLSDEEKSEMAKRDKIWKRPNYNELVDSGASKYVLFWRNEMRKAVKPHPDSDCEGYVEFVLKIKEDVEKCKEMSDILGFYDNSIFDYFTNEENNRWKYKKSSYRNFCNGNTILKYVYGTEKKIKKNCDNSDFLEDSSVKADKKYSIIEVKKEDIISEPRTERPGQYVNKIKRGCGTYFFYTQTNFADLAKNAENNTLSIVLYDNKLLDVFSSKQEAEEAVQKDKEKKNKQKELSKKNAFLPPHLSNIERTGSNYNFFRLSDGNALLVRYGLRGGEFGNYTTSKDRLSNINMAYDAFEDLYKACSISPADISLGGKLAIAFGARGRGNALAHYEPEKNVINMTKIRGAGSLAHEWGHALDKFLGMTYDLHGFMSENTSSDSVPDIAKALIESFSVQNGQETKFFRDSKSFDKSFKKSGNGYWSSTVEMFARAFACYVKDKLKDKKSDYLVGHAECAQEGAKKAYPIGDERAVINKNFDLLFEELIKENVFSKYEERTVNNKEGYTDTLDDNVMLFESNDGQMMLLTC